MHLPFDIFTDSPDSQPVWIESAQDIEDARERLREVARIAPRRDCSFIQTSGASWKSLSTPIFRHSGGTLASHKSSQEILRAGNAVVIHVETGTYVSSLAESKPSINACHSSSSVGRLNWCPARSYQYSAFEACPPLRCRYA